MRSIALTVVLAACTGTSAPAPSDCAPVEAMSRGEIPSPMPDAVRWWSLVERCGAPDGDTCDRAWVDAASMPSMEEPSPTEAESEIRRLAYVAACRTLPRDTQLCLLASHSIANPGLCPPTAAREALLRAME
jgi:hypothetical protein